MNKKVRVKAKRGIWMKQAQGIGIIECLVKDISTAQEREEAIAQAGIAVGYANAMQQYGLLSESELIDMINMLGQVGENALDRIEQQTRRPPLFHTLFGRR